VPNLPLPEGVDWLVPQWPAPQNVHAICTTRAGGASTSPWSSLNLGTHVGDDAAAVLHNRAVLASALGVRPAFMEQVHGTHVQHLALGMADGCVADAAVTHLSGLACTVMVADCLPVLLCDTEGRQVAALHAGWRGLAGQGGVGILEAGIMPFMDIATVEYAEEAIKVIAWLGPCIGPDAFEVGDEVRAVFVQHATQAATCFKPLGGGKWLADLAGLARQRLRAIGVTEIYGNDSSAPWCTVGNPLRFFSHRRDRVSGRQAACIWLE
jgi:YfiH family protein